MGMGKFSLSLNTTYPNLQIFFVFSIYYFLRLIVLVECGSFL